MYSLIAIVTALVGTTAAAGAIYKVKDLSGPDLTGQFASGYVDLGIPQLTQDGRMFFVGGDTFESGIGGSNWRAPTGFYSSNPSLSDLLIDGCVSGSAAVGLVPEGHVAVGAGYTTAIPSDVFSANGKLYMNLMRGVIYETDHTDFWVSEDDGASWTYLFLWPGDMYGSQFQQKTFAVGDDGYVYCLSTVFNRQQVSDLLLVRVPIGSIEDQSAWEPWGYANGAWAWGNAPTTIATSREWGEISWRNLGNDQWVFTFLNMNPLGIHYMLLNGPTDNLFAAGEEVLIYPADTLADEHDNYVASPYGGFIFPGSTVDSFDFCVSQWNGDTYRFMQFHADGLASSAASLHQRADVIFSEDFESGNLDQWDYQACPGGVTISTDVARTGSSSAKFVVYDNSTDANCQDVPTENPRAQLVSPGLFSDGDEYYTAVSVYFPEDFPQPTDWFQLIEFYGPPFDGSPTMGVDICNGNHICFEQDASHNYANIWQSSEIQLGAWRDLVFHINFSTDENTGFVEIYDGGKLQTMSNGDTRTYYKTLNPSCNWDGSTPNSLFLNQYRAPDSVSGGVTLYQDSVKVGTSLASVMPSS